MKKILFKKMACFLLIGSILLPAQPSSAKAAETYVAEPSAEEISSLADFNAMDDLIEQRVDALEEGDMDAYNEIYEELEEHGCEDISASELQQLTGETQKDSFNSRLRPENSASSYGISPYSAASTNVKFTKSVTSVTYGGKVYTVMKVTASPSGRGTLYKTGSVTKRYNTSVKASALNMLKVAVKKLGGNLNVVKAISFYDAVKSSFKTIKETTKIDDVKANYTWTVQEICSFIYIYDKDIKNYRIGASYNKAKYIVAASIPQFKLPNGKIHYDIIQKKYSEWITPANYGNTSKAISAFKQGRPYRSWVNNIKMSGCNGKTIQNVTLQHPETAIQLGYWTT